MLSSARLTKKQKKGIAFRAGKLGKGARKNGVGTSSDGTEDNAIPVLEIQASLDVEDVEMENGTVSPEEEIAYDVPPARTDKGKAKAAEQETDVGTVPANQKRKRDAEPGLAKVKEKEGKEDVVPKKKKKGNDEKQRFILFVGNLKYTTSMESIKEHFAACDPPPSVRLLTPKISKSNNKSKGCAFLEFTHRNALQQALKLDQSQLDGRAINVELTSGGGGKSEARLQKLKERNKKLHEQRKERQGDNEEITHRQRYSATSGVGAIPDAKKTWAVDDAEDSNVHRGGKKHKKHSRSQRSKEWRTGVNAIPVG
ncbi:hypothetical protein J3R30DRAFT_1420197 [Lentinula aciculospora]|uniref:RRM domain-containing protein n=1 Tax=Lentinula aciculospora TaxID=153920 RepID=A0A9W9DTX4_9AGAR|nr:hypothetical protein J3R30DRAFT_1420197 [Lentinula aciculospora]